MTLLGIILAGYGVSLYPDVDGPPSRLRCVLATLVLFVGWLFIAAGFGL